MRKTAWRYLLVAFFAVVLLGAAPAGAALAANPDVQTATFHKRTEVFTDVLPCTNIPYEITAVLNGVEHFQLRDRPSGDVFAQFTFTETGKFSAEPVSGTGATYTGSFTVWGGGMAVNPVFGGPDGEIIDADKWVNTFTFTVRGIGSDGSRIFEHDTAHINVNPIGHTNEFFKTSCPS